MLEILKFIFSDFWIWAGTTFTIVSSIGAVSLIFERQKATD